MYHPVLALITRLPCAVRVVKVQKMSGRDLHPFTFRACYALTYLLLSTRLFQLHTRRFNLVRCNRHIAVHFQNLLSTVLSK